MTGTCKAKGPGCFHLAGDVSPTPQVLQIALLPETSCWLWAIIINEAHCILQWGGDFHSANHISKTAKSRHWFWGNTYLFGNGNSEIFKCLQVQMLPKTRYIHVKNFFLELIEQNIMHLHTYIQCGI